MTRVQHVIYIPENLGDVIKKAQPCKKECPIHLRYQFVADSSEEISTFVSIRI